MKIFPNIDESVVKTASITENMIQQGLVAAAAYSTIYGQALPSSNDDIQPSGAHFTIPLVIPEGMPSGDGRIFDRDALTSRTMPLTLMWQEKTDDGHKGSYIVGRIDSVDYIEGVGLVNGRGVFDVGPYGREAERLVRNRFLRGISADLDEFSAYTEDDDEVEEPEDDKLADKGKPKPKNDIKNRKITVESARLMAVTLVAKPAFQECFIMIDPEPTLSDGDEYVPDGTYEDMLDDIDNELAALAASAAPVIPPRDWFINPNLNGPTPLTVDDDGRVFGHIAAWNVNHIGLSRATKPPRSASKYAYFRTGVVRTDDGQDVKVGQLTLAGGHAPLSASAADAVKHYDDTNSAVADVVAGEDMFGIWVSGALRPDLTPSQVRAFRASAPSGDWRPINGRLELVAVCSVNVPGFPVARSMVAGGQLTALVAAGAEPLAMLRENNVSRLEERVNKLESMELSFRRDQALKKMAFAAAEPQPAEDLQALAASAKARMASLMPDPDAELALKIQELRNRFNNL